MSDVHRKQVTAGTVAQRLAETVTQAAYVNCGAYPVTAPAGYTTSVAVRYWNPSWTAAESTLALIFDAVTSRLRDPTQFWRKLAARPVVRDVPTEVRSLLEAALPETRLELRMVYRQPGLGSLGRPRFTALAEWRGGKVAREAKALVPSAWLWAASTAGNRQIYYDECVRRAVRAHDPFLQTQGAWILRRLSPYCSRIELRQMPRWRDEQQLLWAMGYELANVQLGTRGASARIRADLRSHKPKWLRQCAEAMAEATVADWKEWKRKTV